MLSISFGQNTVVACSAGRCVSTPQNFQEALKMKAAGYQLVILAEYAYNVLEARDGRFYFENTRIGYPKGV